MFNAVVLVMNLLMVVLNFGSKIGKTKRASMSNVASEDPRFDMPF